MRKPTTRDTAAAVAAINADIGKRIRARRVQIGMSQAELGDHLGVTYQVVQSYEAGAAWRNIGAARLVLIAEALGVPVAFFYDTLDAAADANAAAVADTIGLLGERGAQDLLAAYGAMNAHERSVFLEIARLVADANAIRGEAPEDRPKRAT